MSDEAEKQRWMQARDAAFWAMVLVQRSALLEMERNGNTTAQFVLVPVSLVKQAQTCLDAFRALGAPLELALEQQSDRL
jgi:hypothetical protein